MLARTSTHQLFQQKFHDTVEELEQLKRERSGLMNASHVSVTNWLWQSFYNISCFLPYSAILPFLQTKETKMLKNIDAQKRIEEKLKIEKSQLETEAANLRDQLAFSKVWVHLQVVH